MAKRILVAGGAGFLGSHLCDLLLARGHEVICLDNFYTGSKNNIAHLRDHQRFECIRHDVTLPIFLEVDVIYNLASPASPVQYQRFPVQTIKTNIMGAINLLGMAKRLRIPYLQASTSEVYGDPKVHPQTESYWGHVNPIGVRSCYDEGKRCAETLCFDYHRQFGVEVKVARIFNTYGPRMDPHDGRVVSNFIVQSLRGQALSIFGDGQQTRSFCYVSDLVQGLAALMESPDCSGPVNLGNPSEFSMLTLAEKVRQHTGNNAPLAFHPLPADDPQLRCPDISLAKQALHWEPVVALDEGLKKTVAYFRELIGMEEGVYA